MKPDCFQFYLWSVGQINLPRPTEAELEEYIEQSKGNS